MIQITTIKVDLAGNISNEAIGETIIRELNGAMHSHFGEYTTREIWKAVFTGIVKYNMMGKTSK